MNSYQKRILVLFLSMTIFILFLDNLFPGEKFVKVIKHATIFSLFVSSLLIRKRYQEKVIMSIAIFFTVVGDFFLNFCSIFPQQTHMLLLYGVMAFAISYIMLIMAYQKNLKLCLAVIFSIIPVLAVMVPVFITIYPHIYSHIFLGSLLFCLLLGYMATISISTLFRGFFTKRVSARIALAGFLILLSDMAIAIDQFHPAYSDQFIPLLKNIIWGTFIPAWTLVVINIYEDHFLSLKK